MAREPLNSEDLVPCPVLSIALPGDALLGHSFCFLCLARRSVTRAVAAEYLLEHHGE